MELEIRVDFCALTFPNIQWFFMRFFRYFAIHIDVAELRVALVQKALQISSLCEFQLFPPSDRVFFWNRYRSRRYWASANP